LGHTPFGHAGQDELNACMKEWGGFEHNLQSLRVVDELEQQYAEFDGLNLCFETREGILKHCSRQRAAGLGEIGRRFIEGGQPLGLVDELEQQYAESDELNRDFETREGILRHCSRQRAAGLGEIGRRFIEGGQPLVEAQLANLADEIAYNNHDIDDGLRSGLI